MKKKSRRAGTWREPLKVRGVRVTVPASKKGYGKGTKGGRPKGTYKRYHFSQTKLGFMMRYETPAEYKLVMGDNDTENYFYEPPIEQIEVVAKASPDPSFKKKKFKRYLEEYRKYGNCCFRPKLMTPAREKYYTKMYEMKMKKMKEKIYVPRLKDEIDKDMKVRSLEK